MDKSHLQNPGHQVTDSLADWIAYPVDCFWFWANNYKSERTEDRLGQDSKEIYFAMWRKFVTWLAGNQVRLDNCRMEHVARFLRDAVTNDRRNAGRSSKAVATKTTKTTKTTVPKEHRQRYIRLIEWIYDHLIHLGLPKDYSDNPGRQAGQERLGTGENDLTEFLTDQELKLLIAYIRTGLAEPIPPLSSRVGRDWTRSWTAARDLGLAAATLGAGVRVREISSMTVNCTIKEMDIEPGQDPERRLKIVDPVAKRHRDAKLFEVATLALPRWLEWRKAVKELAIVDTLFPADASRRQADKAEAPAGMHPSTIFRRVSRVLTAAGITGDRQGPQTLRNTYGALLVEAGHSDEEIKEFMGLGSPRGVFRLRDALKARDSQVEQLQAEVPAHRGDRDGT